MTRSAAEMYRSIIPGRLRQRLWHFRRALSFSADENALDPSPHIPAGVVCKVCRSQQIALFENRRTRWIPFDFYRCEDCDYIFVHPVPEPVELYGEAVMPNYGDGAWNVDYLNVIQKYRKPGRLLEIGFGNGSFLKLAHENGWEVHGAEVNRALLDHAKEVLHLPNIRSGTIEQLDFPAEYFDVVAAFNFIEHVPDPAATLTRIREMLQPAGLLVLLCPNIGGIYHSLIAEIFPDSDPLNLTWVPPDHVSYFTKRNFKMLLEANGFSVIGDESQVTSSLWLQHEMSIGPKVTEEKLSEILNQAQSTPWSAGDELVSAYRERILKLVMARMTWAMISDIMRIEPALGAENAILFMAEKTELRRSKSGE